MNNSANSSTHSAKVISIVSTKGGVGKTTTAANLGAFIADSGKKVLLVDLDTQPTLSSYFNLELTKDKGTIEFIGQNNRNLDEIVSKTTLPNLDIIISNDHQNLLNKLLSDAPGGELKLYNLLPIFRPHYDVILFDTQGARSTTLKMSIIASDLAISPVPPEMLAAREFSRGTIQLFIELIEAYSLLGIHIPQVQLLINRADYGSNDSKIIAEGLRSTFKTNPLVKVLETYIPAIATYRKAATVQEPAHRYETKRPQGRVAPAALDSLKNLACEVFPEWQEDFNKLTPDMLETIFQKRIAQSV
ncbi:ParA family protein [Entomomonas sp. E2T0]|uniref:ParA family protein n=1 Tax=Entomomonas sp. E2T0 TaxID=2930213 RepID=UPI0022282E92|nr:ParA family protein [Entomomonas sp. E2T0]UYZ83118.1 ParA family protein [Entomomonas sp. E2T0]